MTALSITPALSPADRKAFLLLPWSIYRGDPNWVPPLLGEVKKLLAHSHPFHRHAETALFLAKRGGKPVGRISACVNRAHLEAHKDGAGFWGFFECEDSHETASALFDAAGTWLRERGMKTLRGPCSFSTNEECGLLVEGFHEPPTFMMTYNPKFYVPLVEGCGFAKAKDLWAWFVDKPAFTPPEKLWRVANRMKEREGITVRPVDMKRVEQELELLRDVYNKAWANNWGAIPMSAEEFEVVADDFRKIVRPEYLLFAEVKGRPAGFSLALPDYNFVIRKMNGSLFPFGWLKWLLNVKKIHRLRYITMGIVPEFQKRGIDAIFYIETMQAGLKAGFDSCEMSWILEDNNAMNTTVEAFGAKRSKVYRIYDRAL
ncbi:MAG: N-acetyltransferase [Planctomycetes bacterium]|nr:N-acetyltransferase [Planctomycetota bacterium]